MGKGSEIYRIDSIGRGYLAIMAHPASNGDPESTIAALAARGIQQVVSLLETGEAQMLGLSREAELVSQHSMRFLSFPIPDMGIPGSLEDFTQVAQQLYQQVDSGISTLIHCRGGIGRSGLLAAAVLLRRGMDAQQALAQVARLRGMRVPETVAQGEWLAANQATISGAAQLQASR